MGFHEQSGNPDRHCRPGQHRGQPWLTQVLVKLYELDQYDDAELVRKKLAASQNQEALA